MALKGPGVSLTDSDEWVTPQSALIPVRDTIGKQVREVVDSKLVKILDEANHGWVKEILEGQVRHILLALEEEKRISDFSLFNVDVNKHRIIVEMRIKEKKEQKYSMQTVIGHSGLTRTKRLSNEAFDRAMEGV